MEKQQLSHKEILENIFTDDLTIQQHIDNLHDFMFFWVNSKTVFQEDYKKKMLKTYSDLRYALECSKGHENSSQYSVKNRINKN